MNLSEVRKLDVGDEVRWNDPDNALCSGVYRVQEIVTPTCRVDTEDSVLVVTDGDGHCAEVFASELG
jgi:hypothetical protein